MSPKKQKQLRNNIIKFIIGIILLFFVGDFLMKNDIERKAWFSSFEVLWQKAQVIGVRVTGGDYKLLETKQSLRRFFVELDKTMSSCPSPVLGEQVHNNIKKMDNMNLTNFAKNLTDLSTQAREIQEQIDQTCGKK